MFRNITSRRTKKIIYLIINILIMCLIFSFSAQPAEQSGAVSQGFIQNIIRIIAAPVFKTDTSIQQFAKSADGVVRKLAHFSIYTVFGIFMFLFISQFEFKKVKSYFISVPFVFLYAVSDEFHQYFVPGRSCEFRDMMIDLSGAITGTLIIILIKYLKERKRKV